MPDCCASSRPRDASTCLPEPEAEAHAHSERLIEVIRAELVQQGGLLSFDRYMELALYAPGLGYYMAGARKFGASGDFITAPEISPLFGRCLARQCLQVLEALEGGDLFEFGAGSGRLAADLLSELEQLGGLPERYQILEVSPDLRARQRSTLEREVPHLIDRVEWLDAMPGPGFRGVVLANEVLDAMPVHRFRVEADGLKEQFVEWAAGTLQNRWEPPRSPGLVAAVEGLGIPFPEGYESEINRRAAPWMRELGRSIEAGLVLLIDYGYPRGEFYHLQRSRGTLLCHYRHRVHPDPLALVGLQDITAHVDFTAVAEAGQGAGLEVNGFTTQAYFLMGCGMGRILAESDPNDIRAHLELVQGIKRLTLPSEMGERFKVLGLTRGVAQPLIGFGMRDQCERL